MSLRRTHPNASNVGSPPPDRARPLLLGGEQYADRVERSGGGGEKYDPYTPKEAQERLFPQVTALRQDVSALDTKLRGRNVVFEAKMLANYLAGSHFPAEVVRSAGLEVVGSRSTSGRLVRHDAEEVQATKTLLLSGDDTSVKRLETLLERTPGPEENRFWTSITRLDEVALTPPERVVRSRPDNFGEGELFTWEAVLHPQTLREGYAAEQARREVLEKWEALVRELYGEVDLDDGRVISGLTFIPVALTVDALESIARFNPLRCIRLMPRVRSLRIPVSRSEQHHVIRPPAPNAVPLSTRRIAIFDGGVDLTCPFVAPFVRQVDLTSEPPADEDLLHGAAVTTTALYGYPREDGSVPTPPLGVDHFRVLPLPQISRITHGSADDVDRELYWLLDQIDREVRRGTYPIVNLSIGPELAVDDDGEPDRWTSTLDLLARDKGVLFVTAAGNDGEKRSFPGQHRVQIPADMVNGLGVGSCTARAGTPQGRTVNRSTYSSQGPGRWGARVQPAGVAFGGVMVSNPFVGILPHGRLGAMEGTSFAAPLTSNGLASLVPALGENRVSPALLRAFAVHFAERRRTKHNLDEIGFGRFRERYDDLWIGGPEEVSVVYEGAVNRDGVVSFALPVPDGLPSNVKIEIWWTVCATVPVAVREPVEYTKAGFETLFRPHREIFSFNHSETKKRIGVANVRADRTEVRRLLRLGGEQSRMPVAKSKPRVGSAEQSLREMGKWETVIQQRFSRLEAPTLLGPTLELKHIARDGGMLQHDVDALPFSMLVTVRAHGTTTPAALYDRVLAGFPLLLPASTVQTQLEV